MNVRGDANRSVRMTKRRLCEALIQLLTQKPVHDITVRELTRLAKVSRGTFYFHYSDIYDLMEQVEHEQIDGLNLLMDALLPQLDQEAPPHALQVLFEYLDENDGICSALLGPNGDPAFVQRLEALISQRCMGYIAPEGAGTFRQKYLTSFAVHGCFGTIAAWLYGGKQQTAGEMAQITWQAIYAVRQPPRLGVASN